MSKLLLLGGMLLIINSPQLFAQTASIPTPMSCPTAADIKKNKMNDWIVLYQKNESSASGDDVKKLIAIVEQFDKAKWIGPKPQSGRCYYKDKKGKEAITDILFLARKTWCPTIDPHWQWVEKNTAECKSKTFDVDECQFLV